ncbi:interferon regulatory factor 3 [Nerophis lumbriciformis]|uniref:interferon regulatory factor 3 n=1 Tax=Nerophis lumbriciformis TaxID=546530 RepID=UPI002ADFC955|nr:interferon regulatory factor 3-like [Nerophis lumbriciformis]
MAHSKPLFVQWLRAEIDSGKYPGVQWTNQQETEFCIPWKHALRQDSSDTDSLIFKAWAKVSGNGRVQGDSSVWKRNFRSVLRAKEFKMMADNKNDTANPHKVYRWPKDSTSPDNFIAVALSQQEPDLYESPPNEDILQRCVTELNIGPQTEDTAAFKLPPEQQELRHQLVIGGHALPGRQPYPVALEGAVCEAGLPQQPVRPMTPAEGGVCGGQFAVQFLDTVNKTKEGNHFKTQYRISVFYRGEMVSEQLVNNEAGFRLIYRPQLVEPTLDQESGLSLVSLPSPTTIISQVQAEYTKRILDNLGEGFELAVAGNVIYGQRRGESKVFWSFSKFDQSRNTQEISKQQRQPLYQFTNFIQGILDFIGGKECAPCSLFFCLGEKWPDPEMRPWNKKLITVEVVLTSLEILKNLAVDGGASSLQSVDLQVSLEEMVIG